MFGKPSSITLVMVIILSSFAMGSDHGRHHRLPSSTFKEAGKSRLKGIWKGEKVIQETEPKQEECQDLSVNECAELIAPKLCMLSVDLETGDQLEMIVEPDDIKESIVHGEKLKSEVSSAADLVQENKNNQRARIYHNENEDGDDDIFDDYIIPNDERLENGEGALNSPPLCHGIDCEQNPFLLNSIRRRLWIFDPDTRYEVINANWHPANKAGMLTFNGGHCSAALIAPNYIMTAGHCVHEGGSSGDWYSDFRFYLARTSQGYTALYYGVRAWSLVGWVNNKDYDYDIAIIQLSRETGYGWMSFGYDTSISTSWYLYSKGYPGDKPYGSMWSANGYVSDANTNSLEYDQLDTVGGQSGSGMYSYNPGFPSIYGVHSAAWSRNWIFWTEYWNQATRITAAKFNVFCDIINDPRVC